MQGILLPAELSWLSTVDNAPIMASSMLTQVVASAQLPDMIQLAIDEHVGHFVDAVGACERLLKQPIPVAYTRLAQHNSSVNLTQPIRSSRACFCQSP